MSTSRSTPETSSSLPTREPMPEEASPEVIVIEDSDTDSNRGNGGADSQPVARFGYSNAMTAGIMELFLQCRRDGMLKGVRKQKAAWQRIAGEAAVRWPEHPWTPPKIAAKFEYEQAKYETWLGFRNHRGVRYNATTRLLEADDEAWRAACELHKHSRGAKYTWFRRTPLGDPDVYREVFPDAFAPGSYIMSVEDLLGLPSGSRQSSAPRPSSAPRQSSTPRRYPAPQAGSSSTRQPPQSRLPRKRPIDMTDPDENPTLPEGLLEWERKYGWGRR